MKKRKRKQIEAVTRLKVARDYMRLVDYHPDIPTMLLIIGAVDDAFEEDLRRKIEFNKFMEELAAEDDDYSGDEEEGGDDED